MAVAACPRWASGLGPKAHRLKEGDDLPLADRGIAFLACIHAFIRQCRYISPELGAPEPVRQTCAVSRSNRKAPPSQPTMAPRIPSHRLTLRLRTIFYLPLDQYPVLERQDRGLCINPIESAPRRIEKLNPGQTHGSCEPEGEHPVAMAREDGGETGLAFIPKPALQPGQVEPVVQDPLLAGVASPAEGHPGPEVRSLAAKGEIARKRQRVHGPVLTQTDEGLSDLGGRPGLRWKGLDLGLLAD